MWKASIVGVLIAMPLLVMSAGLVPCGGMGEEPCQSCHVIQLINSVTDWLVMILGIIAALIIVISGFRLVLSSGDVSAKTQAKSMISSMLVGYIIVLAGWMLVDVGLKAFLKESNYGVWNSIQCVAQPIGGRPTASGENKAPLPPEVVEERVETIKSSGSLQTDIEAAATLAGITDPEQVKTLKALISQESSNCTNKVGPPTESGVAYGCGQLLVSTAKQLDPERLGELSAAEIATILRDEDTYNLTLSAQYYNQLLSNYNNDTDLALAAYNGGPGANLDSVDCPGLHRWQCVWDSPGCYGTSRTDCKRNEGPDSYEQTRNYVRNIKAVARGL